MITINGNKVIEVPREDFKIRLVWVNTYKVWPEDSDKEIISCFARGYWISEYPWTGQLGWKNNI